MREVGERRRRDEGGPLVGEYGRLGELTGRISAPALSTSTGRIRCRHCSDKSGGAALICIRDLIDFIPALGTSVTGCGGGCRHSYEGVETPYRKATERADGLRSGQLGSGEGLCFFSLTHQTGFEKKKGNIRNDDMAGGTMPGGRVRRKGAT